MREELITQRNVEYFSRDGLRTLTGLDENLWEHAIIKELLDNSLDELDRAFSEKRVTEKYISLSTSKGRLVVSDNAGGIPEPVLDNVFNFDVYTSSKRDYRTPTRGAQGNALKTVIGICYLRGYGLAFISSGKSIRYMVNEPKFRASILEFRREIAASQEPDGVIISGVDIAAGSVRDMVRSYYLCNPDVTFDVDGEVFQTVAQPENKTERTYIHWYASDDFHQLVQKIHASDPGRTVRDFCGIFSGTQRIISSLEFPYKRLSEFVNDEQAIYDLYAQLKTLVASPSDRILQRSLVGKDTFLSLYGGPEDWKYKRKFGSYQVGDEYTGAVIPYAIEGFLLSGRGSAKPMSAINNSVPYEDLPFHFTKGVEFLKVGYGGYYSSTSLERILVARGFMEAEGIELYLHVVSPYFAFRDKAKTQINADAFADELLKVVEYLTRDAIKEVERTRRTRNRQYDRERAFRKKKEPAKKHLMAKYLDTALERAKGGYSSVNPRQIFYVIREIVVKEHGIELKRSDYNTFTQDILTQKFQEDPELEDVIYFEPRGFFLDPFAHEQIPLGTRDVIDFISKPRQGRIYTEQVKLYSLQPEILYQQVLFIEKSGYNTIMKESGLIDEFNMGIISTRGFSTRASKKLMQYFIQHGIDVYVLHDCDIFGYMIQDKLASGSNTFCDPLDVTDIGLKVADVIELEKTPEVVKPKNEYHASLRMLTDSEYDFFIVDDYSNKYRRVELNALTNDEFIALVRSKMEKKHFELSQEQLARYVEFDSRELVKDALFEALSLGERDRLLGLAEIDRGKLLKSVLSAISENGSEHWTTTLEKQFNRALRDKVEELTKLAEVVGDRP